MPTVKDTLRRRLREARAGAPPRQRADVAAGLLRTLRGSGLLDPDRTPDQVGRGTVAAFVATRGEPDLGPSCAMVRAAGGTVLLPIPLPGRALGWAPDNGVHVPHGSLPVDVPSTPEVGQGAAGLLALGTHVVLAPALAVDLSGARLGQGGGYYDRLLDELDGRLPVLAVVHDDEVLGEGEVPTQAHDRRVAGAVTPTRVLRFG